MYCENCVHSKVIPDPDPTDSFNSDDKAICCTLLKQKPKMDSKYYSDRQELKTIEVSLRHYQVKKIFSLYECPLKNDGSKTNICTCGSNYKFKWINYEKEICSLYCNDCNRITYGLSINHVKERWNAEQRDPMLDSENAIKEFFNLKENMKNF